MGRSRGDTNLQLQYRPRASPKNDCPHLFSKVEMPTHSPHYWFKMCLKCKEVEWVG